LTLDGLASGLSVSLNIRNLLASFQVHEQITRLRERSLRRGQWVVAVAEVLTVRQILDPK
jgi:hypothetical protein